jgi:tRNA A-37 threonylcarbamoyl transferase component Bud32
VRTSDALEQQIITERLAAVGVPVVRVYADDHDTTIHNFVPGVSADHYLASLKSDDYAAANAFFARQQGALEIAHDNGMIIGDRWPGNTIVNGNSCSLIDFDIRYEGDFGKLAVFEEIFSLFQCLSCLKNRPIAARIAPRFVRGIVRRYGDDAYSVWQALRDFYDNSDKPENNTSFSHETYADTLVIMQQGMNGAKSHFKLPMFMRRFSLRK